MTKYIDTDRLRANIEALIAGTPSDWIGAPAAIEAYKDALNSIELLQEEQPKVDLEKEIEEHVKGMPMSEFTHESEVGDHWDWAREEFRHFFELGLNARKKENK